MSNYCEFTVFMVGKEEEIRKVNNIFSQAYDYHLKPSFVESLDLNNGFEDFSKLCSLDVAKKEAERSGDPEVLNKLENVTKQDFVNIPDTKHLFQVLEYCQEEDLHRLDEYDGNLIGDSDTYISESYGCCVWNVLSCMTDDSLSYYSEAKKKYPKKVFMGTHLEEISKMYPDLRICIVAEDFRFRNSEMLYAVGGKVLYDCKDQRVLRYSSVEEAKEDGINITEDQINKDIYTKCAPWYDMLDGKVCINKDYIFDTLNIMKLG